MNLLDCQKLLLRAGHKVEDYGEEVLVFVCEETGLHFRLDPMENRTTPERAGNLCLLCAKICPKYKK